MVLLLSPMTASAGSSGVTLKLASSTVASGASNTITVTLSSAAPSSGTTLNVTASNAAALSVPATVKVAKGKKAVTFDVKGKTVQTDTAVTVTVSGTPGSASAKLTVVPVRVKALTLSASTAASGVKVTGTLTLNAPAPADGAKVAITITGPATAPATVTINKGEKTTTFSIKASVVEAQAKATISASLQGGKVSQSLTVVPIQVKAITFDAKSVVVGSILQGKIDLNGPAGEDGVDVQIVITGPAGGDEWVSIAEGKTSGSFKVWGNPVSASTKATIGAVYNEVTTSTSITVLPIQAKSIALSDTTIAGGSTITGTVTLNGRAYGEGALVVLSATGAATVADTVLVPAGQLSADFEIDTNVVQESSKSTINATYGGVKVSAQLTIAPLQLKSLSASTETIGSQGEVEMTLRLNGQTGEDGAIVNISYEGLSTTSHTVEVGAGMSMVTFRVPVGDVTEAKTVKVKASYNGSNVQASFKAIPVELKSVTVSSKSVTAGTKVTVTIALTAPNMSSYRLFVVSSNETAAKVPAAVDVATGKSTVTFTFTAGKVTTSTDAKITVTGGNASKSVTVTVKPKS
jgi:hypothetical protein